MININQINSQSTLNALSALNTTSLTQTNNSVSETLNSTFQALLENETKKAKETTEKTYDLEAIFQEASEKYGVDCDLLKAIAYNESHFQADAVSSAGAVGIMQLMPKIAKALGVEDSYDPYQNIMGGAKLLSQLQDMYDGNQTLMIAAYNAGCGNVAKYGGVPPFEETQNHIKKVMNTLQNGIDAPNISVTLKGTKATESVTTNSTSLYDNYDINSLFSYDEYELLLEYYTKMLDIIASINSDDDDDDNDDNSLADLFKLSYQQQLTNNSTISNTDNYSVESIKNRTALQAVSMYKAQSNYDL